MFEVGALVFKIQSAGAAVFQRDLDQADKSVKKVEGSAKSAKSAIDGQGKSTDELGAKSRKASEDQQKQAQATENQVQAAKTLSLALIAGGAAITAVVGLSIAKFTSFDAAMSNTAAATMATAEEQRLLGDAALKAGADTAFSANEAAAAQEELAKAGLEVTEVVGGGLTGALSLAAAGQLQVARSAEIMATTLKQYNLEADQAAHVSDILAAGAGKAQGSVDDLALALQYVGPVTAGLGISLEETGGALAYLASQGILGERAGTGLRGVLMSLTAPSQIAAKTMKQYGIEIFDGNGKMKSLATVAEILNRQLGGLTEAERSAALGRIFGNEQITTARILYAQGGAAIDEWTDKVNDSGYAAEQAAMRQDNLAGDIEKLGGAFDTALIKTGSGANDVLRDMVQVVTSLVDGYGELPSEVQQGALVFGVIAGAILLTSGAALGLTARFTELRAELQRNNISMGKTAAIGGAVGLALAGVVTIVGLVAQAQADARARAQAYADALRSGGDAADAMVEGLQRVETGLFGWQDFGSPLDAAETLGLSFETVKAAVRGVPEAVDEVDAAVKRAKDSFNQWTGEGKEAYNAAVTLEDGVRREAEAFREGTAASEQYTEATEDGADATRSAADAYLDAAGGAEELNSQLSQLIDQIMSANEANLDTREANRRLIESFAEFDEGLAENGKTLDLNTEAGRKNEENLDAIAAAAMVAASSITDAGGSYEEYRASLESSRQALLDRINDLGIQGQAAEDLADEILRIPSKSEWEAIAKTDNARQRVEELIREYNGRTITLRLTTSQVVVNDRVFGGLRSDQADGSVLKFYANGGSEHHVAQMARAGAWRVWAEPETGGESYIPHAMSKRARSEQIMAETAAILGGVYIPAGAKQFANGSPVSPAAGGGSLTVSLAGAEFTVWMDGQPIRAIIQEQIVAADAQQEAVFLGGRKKRG